MSLVTPGKMATNDATTARTAVTTADQATIDDAHFDPTAAIDGQGMKRAIIIPRFVGGTAPTVIVEPLVRCGTGWARLTKTAALAEGVAAIVDTGGRKVFLRVDTIAGAPTSVSLLCGIFEPFKPDTVLRG